MQEPFEGMARCINSEGLEDRLSVGDLVYVREIRNMPGHVVALKDNALPLVGYHIDRFKLLDINDPSW